MVGNPANTNALIAAKLATGVPPENFSCLTRLDHNRAQAQVSAPLQSDDTTLIPLSHAHLYHMLTFITCSPLSHAHPLITCSPPYHMLIPLSHAHPLITCSSPYHMLTPLSHAHPLITCSPPYHMLTLISPLSHTAVHCKPRPSLSSSSKYPWLYHSLSH